MNLDKRISPPSDKQIEANRRNALKSTGPKTAEGKVSSRMNALKHGLLARQVIIKGEDAGEFEQLRQRFLEELSPVGPLERELVESIAVYFWRLRRTHLVEAGIFELARRKRILKFAIFDLTPLEEEELEAECPGWAERRREMDRRDEADGRKQAPDLAMAFIDDSYNANAFSKLSRYETTIRRSLFTTLRELERIQEKRLSESKHAPATLEWNAD